jgi:hypothetical protein
VTLTTKKVALFSTALIPPVIAVYALTCGIVNGVNEYAAPFRPMNALAQQNAIASSNMKRSSQRRISMSLRLLHCSKPMKQTKSQPTASIKANGYSYVLLSRTSGVMF